MLNIDTNIFSHNLRLTQEYCRLQLSGQLYDNAKVLRSYNPAIIDKPLYSFKSEHFNFDIEPNVNSCTLTNWSVDPVERKNSQLIQRLFELQLIFKEERVSSALNISYQGDILISQFDCTVLDGASEVQSLGLIDIYDLPPIDTWIYIATAKESRLLFAWIPSELWHYANEAVLVNCVDCINWFKKWYPQEYTLIMANPSIRL